MAFVAVVVVVVGSLCLWEQVKVCFNFNFQFQVINLFFFNT
jgi:hypothetical protein